MIVVRRDSTDLFDGVMVLRTGYAVCFLHGRFIIRLLSYGTATTIPRPPHSVRSILSMSLEGLEGVCSYVRNPIFSRQLLVAVRSLSQAPHTPHAVRPCRLPRLGEKDKRTERSSVVVFVERERDGSFYMDRSRGCRR